MPATANSATSAANGGTARRTREERSADTQRRLLDATIDCVIEFGYANVTTARIAERAGVSRGAQVHHFSTKADLVTAAVAHLAVKRAEALFTQSERLRESTDRVGDALDLLWQAHSGPLVEASVELWVAARTDPELRTSLVRVERAVGAGVVELARLLFGEYADRPDFADNLHTANDTMLGLALTGFLSRHSDEMLAARWERAKIRLRRLFEPARSA